MSRVVRIVAVIAVHALAHAGELRAQPSLALHAGRGPDVGAPWLFGGTVGVAAQGLGLRLGGSVNSLPALVDGDSRDPLWAVDADVVLGAQRGSSLRPYLFLGAGLQTPPRDDPSEDALTHWSWGGGVAISLAGPASVFGEARRRTLFDRHRRMVIAEGTRGSELRAGISIDLGGGGRSDHDRRRSKRRRGRHHFEAASTGSATEAVMRSAAASPASP